MGVKLEPPPRIEPEMEDGYVKLTVEQWSMLIAYLERLRTTIQDNFD